MLHLGADEALDVLFVSLHSRGPHHRTRTLQGQSRRTGSPERPRADAQIAPPITFGLFSEGHLGKCSRSLAHEPSLTHSPFAYARQRQDSLARLTL